MQSCSPFEHTLFQTGMLSWEVIGIPGCLEVLTQPQGPLFYKKSFRVLEN